MINNAKKKMNRVEKLINELCPDGVEFKEIQELLNNKVISTISVISKSSVTLFY